MKRLFLRANSPLQNIYKRMNANKFDLVLDIIFLNYAHLVESSLYINLMKLFSGLSAQK